MEHSPAEIYIRNSHTVPPDAPHQRLSDYANGLFAELPSRKAAKKAIDRGLFRIDGSAADTSRWVVPGMVIELIDEAAPAQKAYDCPMPIVYEDGSMAVIVKPAGLPVSGNYFHTVQNALPLLLAPSTFNDAMPVPRPVHRLDGPTTGLLAIAKTYSAAKILGQQFADKSARKKYFAVVCGSAPAEGECRLPIGGQEAHSSWRLAGTSPSLRYGTLSLLELEPHTGRTHQLRIHCAQMGWPIYGDSQYGSDVEIVAGKGLFLAACRLSVVHPLSGQRIDAEMDIPAKFASLFERESRRFAKFDGNSVAYFEPDL